MGKQDDETKRIRKKQRSLKGKEAGPFYEIRHHPELARGTWWWHHAKPAPTVVCPSCCFVQLLSDHAIAEDGVASPMFDCRECPFTEFLKLREWRGRKDKNREEKK